MKNDFEIGDIVEIEYDNCKSYNDTSYYIVEDIIDDNTVKIYDMQSYWDDNYGWIKRNEYDKIEVTSKTINVDNIHLVKNNNEL